MTAGNRRGSGSVPVPGHGHGHADGLTATGRHRGQLTAVYVVKEKTLHYRLVCLGARIGDQTEILAGLQPGEVIVTTDVNRARHGARVED